MARSNLAREAAEKAQRLEQRQIVRKFVINDSHAESQAGSASSENVIMLATHYFEKIASTSHEAFSRVSLTLPPIDFFERMRVNQRSLGDLAVISATSRNEVMIEVKAASHFKLISDTLRRFDTHWKIELQAPVILVSPPAQSASLREHRSSQLRQAARKALNEINERKTNLVKKANLEIRDASQEKMVVAEIFEIAEKFKQAIERLEKQRITEL